MNKETATEVGRDTYNLMSWTSKTDVRSLTEMSGKCFGSDSKELIS